MSDVAAAMPDQPDGRVRAYKAVWRQHRRLVGDCVKAALEGKPYGDVRVSLLGADDALARAIAVDCGVAVSRADVDDGYTGACDHVVALVMPRVMAAKRIELLRWCHRRVRPAGVLIVVATVVVAPGDDARLVPSVSQLAEELNLASGLAVHVDDIQIGALGGRALRSRCGHLGHLVGVGRPAMSNGEIG